MSMKQPTPRNVDDWDEEELEAWNEEKEADLRESMDDDMQLSDEEESALDALGESAAPETTTVTVGDGMEMEVRVYLDHEMEDVAQRIQDVEDLGPQVREDIISLLAWLIVDEQYSSEAVWREYGRKYGTQTLALRFFEVAEPALKRIEDHEAVREFRQE